MLVLLLNVCIDFAFDFDIDLDIAVGMVHIWILISFMLGHVYLFLHTGLAQGVSGQFSAEF